MIRFCRRAPGKTVHTRTAQWCARSLGGQGGTVRTTIWLGTGAKRMSEGGTVGTTIWLGTGAKRMSDIVHPTLYRSCGPLRLSVHPTRSKCVQGVPGSLHQTFVTPQRILQAILVTKSLFSH